MGLSAVSELPEVSTINDQDLLMVSHTDDGVNYTSNKLTYGTLISNISFDAIYPVGSIYISVNPELPSVFRGTWQKLAAGRTLWNVSDVTQLGAEISGSLPNITGKLKGINDKSATNPNLTGSGAFKITQESSYATTGGGSTDSDNPTVVFNASNSNNVYSASAGDSVVRPTSIGVSMWKRTA